MKKIVALTLTASALLAGPDIQPLVDYDAQDMKKAQTQEAQQVTPAPIKAVPLVAPVVVQKCHNGSIDILGGANFTQESSYLDDAAAAGIRVNKCLTNNLFIQAGYEHVFAADYKNRTSSTTTAKARGVQTKSTSGYDDTHLNRIYVNAMYEFNNHNRLYPYVYAGLGYENVSDEAYDVEDQGFYNAGAGLRYGINDKVSLIADARAIRKIENRDIDIVAALGVGMIFGATSTIAQPTEEVTIIPQPDVVPSVISEPAPLATLTQPTVVTEPIVVDSTYYIQIAALFQNQLETSDSPLIKSIDAQNLNYEIQETTVRGKSAQLLLVGPYYSETEARADLSRAKRVEKGAFIKKIKG
ncbi:MAG: porin family protein [Epsilonproteobacteria bacterium]|nr:porin family protein [Campylobacterota bacterium]